MAQYGDLSFSQALQLAEEESESGKFPCPFSGCSKTFARRSVLIAHLRIHTGILGSASVSEPVVQQKCAGQATSPELPPLRRSRRPTRRPRSIPSVFDGIFDESVTKRRKRCQTLSKSMTVARSNQDADVIDQDEIDPSELVANASYFLSQLRTARSEKVVDWKPVDYLNAHRWALWVKESMEDSSNDENLKQMLLQKNLDLDLLYEAEETLFDSILGNGLLDQEMIDSIATAAIKSDDDDDDDNIYKSLSSLADSAGVAVTRRALLNYLTNTLKQFSVSASKDGIPFSAAPASLQDIGCDISTAALGKLLLNRLSKLSSNERDKQLDGLVSNCETGSIKLICSGIVVTKDIQERRVHEVREGFLQRLASLDSKHACDLFLKLDAVLLCDVSELDFEFFRRYTSLLFALLQLVAESMAAEDEKIAELAASRGLGTSKNISWNTLASGRMGLKDDNKASENAGSLAAATDCIDEVRKSFHIQHDPQSLGLQVKVRIRVLLRRCGHVSVTTRMLVDEFLGSLSGRYKAVLHDRLGTIEAS